MRQQLQNRSRASGFGHGRCGRSSSSFCANPPHHHHKQQQGGSGMRAIFLEGSGSKRESVGTGVSCLGGLAVLLNFAGSQVSTFVIRFLSALFAVSYSKDFLISICFSSNVCLCYSLQTQAWKRFILVLFNFDFGNLEEPIGSGCVLI